MDPYFDAPCLGAYDFGPSGIQFNQAVTLTIPYELSGSQQAAQPYWYNSLTAALSKQGITEIKDITISSTLHALTFKEPARNNLDFWMPNCTTSLAASQSPKPRCSSLHLRFGSIGATKSTAHLNPKMSNLFLADP